MLRARALAVTRMSSNASRAIASSTSSRAGMGPAIVPARAPSSELPEDAELTWDAGDAHPEPCIDTLPPHIVSKNTAAMYLAGGIAFLGGVYALAVVVDKPSTVPFAPKTFPYDGLAEALGRR